MASTEKDSERVVLVVNEENFSENSFKCCQSRQTKLLVCVVCGNIFHASCATKNKLKCIKICDTRIQCCKLDQNTTKEFLRAENEMFKKLLQEKDEKYNLLLENNKLLTQNNALLEEKILLLLLILRQCLVFSKQ